MVKTIRHKFVVDFGEDEARKIEDAAHSHANGINSNNMGRDAFKWALLICIGYQCFEVDAYRKYHNIKIPHKKLKKWIIENADLESHDGDCDYLSLACGVYNDYIKKRG